MKISRRVFILIGLVAVLIAGVVLFLPIPMHINATLEGMVCTQNGEYIEPVAAKIDGWKLDYLLFSDKLYVNLDVPDSSYMYIKTSGDIYQTNGSAMLAYFSYYDTEENHVTVGSLKCDSQMTNVLLNFTDGESAYYVFTRDNTANLRDVFLSLNS